MGKTTSTTPKAAPAGTVRTDAQNSTTPPEPEAATAPNSTQTATASDEGAGIGDAGKRAIQSERDAREVAEQEALSIRAELDAFKKSLAQALGLTEAGEPDPAALTAQLAETGTDLTRTKAENAVLRAGAGVANLDLLLDSKRFTDTLTNLDVADAAKVKAHIEAFVEDNPHFKAGKAGGGARDAAAGHRKEPLPEPQPGVARLAQGFEAELDK